MSPPEPVTAFEVKKRQALLHAEVIKQLGDVKLRQWAIEETVKIMVSASAHMGGRITAINMQNPKPLAGIEVEQSSDQITPMTKNLTKFFYEFAINKEETDEQTA